VNYILLFILACATTFGNKQPDIAGEWIVFSATNTEISKKDCTSGWTKYSITFYEDGTYKRPAGGYTTDGGSYRFEGKYKLDGDTLKLFQIKLFPGGTDRTNETYKLISCNGKYFSINQCFCVKGEYDDRISNNCITTYKRIK
jgi:hypothetical protein